MEYVNQILLNGVLFITDSELRPLLQTSTTSLEYTHTPNYGQTRPVRSGASVTSQYQGHMGAVTRLRSASVEWQEFLLPDGSRYFSHRTLRIVTDVDLRGVERLDAITRFLDEPNMETIPPPGWELWLRDGHKSTISFIPSQAWIHHGKRMVVFESPAPDLGELMSSDIDKMESEYQYWLFMVSHPVHAPLPPESVAEAIEVLTWFYINRLLPSPRLSPPPFSEEECQELLMQLRSFNREPSDSDLWPPDVYPPRHVCTDCVTCPHMCCIYSSCSCW
ncbi:hypothetical protein F5148DRAFT_978126 [Russula earlei]|uniref:Uncharacterized protein n=1 Tax=Russula earlei TaxID=71964 RepID=A0ACC0UD47_9AGAM|nr:hypothetical protein F5148DRAFT_978126 [Russula earlei]